MNIQQAASSSFKIFNRLGKDRKKLQVEAVEYIALLASQTGTRTESWDLVKLFGTGKGATLITDKTEINRKFFAQIEAVKASALTVIPSLDEATFKKIDELSVSRVCGGKRTANSIEALKKRQERYAKMIEKYFLMANQYIEKASKLDKQITVLEGRRTNYASQINELLKENFWEFYGLTGSSIELVTRTDVTIRYRNPAAGINYTVNMGRYLAALDLSGNYITVHPFKNNIMVDRYPHPHVSGSTNVCWGNASSTVAQCLSKGDIGTVFRLLASILTGYNDGNPYVNIEQFVKNQNRRSK